MAQVREPYCHSGAHLTDTILVIEDVDILVHRKLLAILSPVFERLLFGGFKENNETRIVLKDVQLDTMYDCLDIMHGVDLKYTPGQMGTERLNNLLLYADRFDIDMVLFFCRWELNIESAGNEIDRYLLACQHGLDDCVKETLFTFLTARKVLRWTSAALADRKASLLSLDETDLARLFAVCVGQESAVRSLKSNDEGQTFKQLSAARELIRNKWKGQEGFNDAIIEVEGERIHVNRSMLCYLSPFFYTAFGGTREMAELRDTVQLKNVKAAVLQDCLSIVVGRPISIDNDMTTARLFHLLYLSARFSLSAVTVFCTMTLALPAPGTELERYLLACHFNLSCKTVLLSRLSASTLHDLSLYPLASQIPLDSLYFDVDDIRSILAISSSIDIPPMKHVAVAQTALESSTAFKKSSDTDVVLIVGESEFYVNRMMMARLSPYFNKLLVIEAKEQQSRFVLEDVDASVFSLCLHIVYGKMPVEYKKGKLSASDMIGLLDCAHRFELEPVKLFCDREVFENEKGHKMDRFLITSSYYPQEIEALLANLEYHDIIDWLERDVSFNFLPLARCIVKLTLKQLDRLIQLTYGELLVDQKSSIHIRPSSLSWQDVSKKMYLIVTNKGTENILLEYFQSHRSRRLERHKKLAPGETSRILIEDVNSLLYYIFTVPNIYWNREPESIRTWECTHISTIRIPLTQ